MFSEKKLKKRVKKLKKLGLKKKMAKKIAALDETAVKEAIAVSLEAGGDMDVLQQAWTDYAGQAAEAGMDDPAVLTQWVMQTAEKEASEAVTEMVSSMPGDLSDTTRMPSSSTEFESYLKDLEAQLNTVGDDAQLANTDMQNILQKQQQTLQMLSNISKMMHDTSMSIIRKIGG